MKGTVLVFFLIGIVVLAACNGDPTSSPVPTESPLVADGDAVAGGAEGGLDFASALEWVLEHIEEIALVAGLAVSVISGGLKKARALAVSLMLEAEKVAREEIEMGGPEKMERVIGQFIEELPADAKALLRVWAGFRGQSLDALVAELAQQWYDVAIGG
jgi:hypothetical protein